MCKSTQQALFASSLERRSFLALEDPTLCTEMMLSWEVGAAFIPQWAVCSAHHSVQGVGGHTQWGARSPGPRRNKGFPGLALELVSP